jgi:hypothetical protein
VEHPVAVGITVNGRIALQVYFYVANGMLAGIDHVALDADFLGSSANWPSKQNEIKPKCTQVQGGFVHVVDCMVITFKLQRKITNVNRLPGAPFINCSSKGIKYVYF